MFDQQELSNSVLGGMWAFGGKQRDSNQPSQLKPTWKGGKKMQKCCEEWINKYT